MLQVGVTEIKMDGWKDRWTEDGRTDGRKDGGWMNPELKSEGASGLDCAHSPSLP
jgi:hypothetical protein